MGFFKKDKVNEPESAKVAPQPRESSLAVVSDSDNEFETVESDEDIPIELPKKQAPKPAAKVEAPVEDENDEQSEDIDSNLSFEEQEEILKEKIAAIQRQKQKALEEAEAKRQAEMQNESFPQYQPAVYLSEAELLREMNRKLDLLLSLFAPK